MNQRDLVFNLIANTSRFTGPVQGAIGPLRSLETLAGSGAGKLKVFGAGAAAAGVGAAALGAQIVSTSVKAFADFDAEMTKSLAIMGDVSETMRGDMSDAAREVARTTTFSANEAAQSFFYLSSAGLDAAQSIEALPKVAAFAQAGAFDMATATDLLTDAQSALGLSVEDTTENMANMTRVSDVLVRANTLANATVQQFSEALTNKAGAALRVLNKDVEEGAAVLAVYADQGLKGAAAGEALNIVMRDLQKASIENRDVFDEFGIKVFDTAGNMRNLADIVSDVENATAGMSDETRKATLSQLGFQERSVAQIIALLGTSDAIREYEGALRSAGGTTEDVAGKQLETLNAQFDLLASKVSDAKLELGEELAPAFSDLIPQLETLVELGTTLAVTMGPTLADAVEVGFRAVEGTIETVLRGLEALGNEDAGAAADLIEVMSAIRRDAIPGATNIQRLEQALAGLGARGSLTKQNIEAVAGALGVTDEELLRVLPTVRAWTGALGENITTADDWFRAVDAGVHPLQNAGQETNAFAEEVIRLERELNAAAHAEQFATSESIKFKDAASDAAPPVEELGGAAEETEPPVRQLGDALAHAKNEQLGLTAAVKSFSDPLFAANNAMNRYETAAAKVDELNKKGKEGTDEWVDAMFDMASAKIDAQQALEELGDGNIVAGLTVIADALGISVLKMQEMAEQAGILDGTEINVLIDFEQRYRTTGEPGRDPISEKAAREAAQEVTAPLVSTRPTGRALGGPVSPQMIHQVGEGNMPELLMIPGDRGHMFSNTDSKALIRALSAGGSSPTFNVTLQSTGNFARDVQLAGIQLSTRHLVRGGLPGGAR